MSHFSLASPVVVTAFSMAVFRFLDKLSTEVQLHLPLNRDLYPDCLQLEWNEFYTKDICSFIFPMSLEVLGRFVLALLVQFGLQIVRKLCSVAMLNLYCGDCKPLGCRFCRRMPVGGHVHWHTAAESVF